MTARLTRQMTLTPANHRYKPHTTCIGTPYRFEKDQLVIRLSKHWEE